MTAAVKLRHPPKPFGLVAWADAHGTADIEVREDEISHQAALFHSYGWVIKSDATGVTLAAEWSPNSSTYRAVMFIPRGMVVEEVVFALATPRRRKAKVPAS